MGAEKLYCNKCNTTKAVTAFYTYRDGTKMELCKNCLTRHLDNFNEETYEWIFKKLDYPYVPEMWNKIRQEQIEKHPNKILSSTAVLGRYISSMKLKQWKDKGYDDSEQVAKEWREQNEEYMREVNLNFQNIDKQELDRLYESGDISEAEYKTFSSPESATDARYYSAEPLIKNSNPAPAPVYELEVDLTEDDKKYLSIKWGPYTPQQWVRLEESYKKMTESFDIRDADTIATLKLLCKTELKMNEFIDNGDIESFQKLSRVYESLRKTSKFTAAQNKELSSDAIDSVGELVAMCEKEGGFIPRFCLDVPQDKIDATIMDMKKYTHDLVTEEMGLGKMIEEAAQQIQLQMQEDQKDIMDYEEEVLNDADFQDYFDSVDEESEEEDNGIS